jgi:hypothetical protein
VSIPSTVERRQGVHPTPTKERVMKYLCLAYGDRAKMEKLSKEGFEALVAKCRLHDEELHRSGRFVSGQSLEWDAKTIRPRGGRPVVTDGPFIEAREVVGGLVIIEAESMDEAVRVASLHPAAHLGEDLGWAVEVRPIADACHQ